MLRYIPTQGSLAPGLIIVLATIWTIIVLVLVWAASFVLASSRSNEAGFLFRRSLVPAANFINHTGKDTVVRGTIATILDLGHDDLPVRERGFRGEGEKLTHVCTTVTQSAKTIAVILALVDEDTGNATIWRATTNGELVASAKFVNGRATKIPNEEGQTLFVAEKEYILRQVQLNSFRTNPAPTPKSQSTPAPIGDAVNVSTSQKRTHQTLHSELMLLFLNPWVVPAIAVILAMGIHRASRSE